MDARRMVVSLGALALTACETNRNETRPEDLARAAFVDGGNACTRVLCRAETYFADQANCSCFLASRDADVIQATVSCPRVE